MSCFSSRLGPKSPAASLGFQKYDMRVIRPQHVAASRDHAVENGLYRAGQIAIAEFVQRCQPNLGMGQILKSGIMSLGVV